MRSANRSGHCGRPCASWPSRGRLPRWRRCSPGGGSHVPGARWACSSAARTRPQSASSAALSAPLLALLLDLHLALELAPRALGEREVALVQLQLLLLAQVLGVDELVVRAFEG